MNHLPAYKLPIHDILDLPLIRQDKTVALTQGDTTIHRVNIMATVVSTMLEQQLIIVDDGTGQVPVQWFDDRHPPITVGDLVLVIGRVREFNHRYLFPEILKKLSDPLWMTVRQTELSLREPALTPSESPQEENHALKLIHDRDEGLGADMNEIVKELGAHGEDIIKKLLMAGEIFESRPGKLRIL